MTNSPDQAKRARTTRAIPIFAAIIGITFLCEVIVMAILHSLHLIGLWCIILDPILLAGLSSPLLFWFVFRPIHNAAEEHRRSNESLRKSEEHLRVTLASIGDAVIAVDTDRRVENLNGTAEQLTGWTLEEARGRPLAEVFQIINEETRKPVRNPVARVIVSGQIEGLANHTVLIARDGTERAIADSAAPIQDASGRTIGVVLVFRDITEERDRQKEKEQLLHDMGERIKELNCLYGLSKIVEKPGITPEGILQEMVQLLPPSWQYPLIASGHIRFEGQVFETDACPQGPWCQSSDIEVNGRKAGSIEVCYREARPEADEGPFLKEERALIDAVAERLGRIIERKQAKEESQRHLQELERFNRLTVGREQRMIELKREVNEMAHKGGLAPPYDLAFAESGKGGIGDEL